MPESSDQQLLKLSVILITSDIYSSIRKTIGCLQKQTTHQFLEIVIVAPDQSSLALMEEDLSLFGAYQVVEVGTIASMGQAYGAGIRAAQAPIVVLGEDHCFPEPGWAQALLQAHKQIYAVVGPALSNANPSTATSWADMLIAYAPWMDPAVSQTVSFLPGHNSSYKRQVLLSYGSRLDAMLESETVLHWDLRSQGYELFLEAEAKAAHTNFAQLGPWLPIQFRAGRIFAAGRAEGKRWSWPQRLVYLAASPLIPLVRFSRILQSLNQAERRHRVPLPRGTFLITLMGLAADGLGQMVGYGLGYGKTLQQYADAEFHRELYLAEADKMAPDQAYEKIG